MTIDTAAIRARAEAATAGPWRVSSTGYSVKSPTDDMAIVTSNPWGSGMSTTKQIEPWLDNAEFIAAARTDVPALCDALDAERTDNARLREMLGLAWDNVAKEQRALDAERAKVERLRVALRDTLEIAHSDDSDLPTGWTATLEAARAALEGE